MNTPELRPFRVIAHFGCRVYTIRVQARHAAAAAGMVEEDLRHRRGVEVDELRVEAVTR